MGSGAIGIEFACFYRTMGADVTVVEVLPQIMPVEDAEIAGVARKRFEKQGMKIMTATKVTKVEKNGEFRRLHRRGRQGRQDADLKAERLISAVGVVGNTEDLGLEKLGVKIERGAIVTDGLRPHQCRGHLRHRRRRRPADAGAQGRARGRDLRRGDQGPASARRWKRPMIPGCTYCHPQVASVGLTEAKAKEQRAAIKVGRFPFVGNGKAIALGEPDGLVKTIFDAKTGKLLGAHMVGAEVTELIQGFVVAMNCETTEEELIHAVFPHPTLSEMMHESVLDAYGRVIHT